MSPNAADTLLTGADPKTPPKNLVIKMAAGVLLVAVPIEKRPRQNIAGSILHFRPQTSLIGAHSEGPKAKPSMYRLSDSVATSGLTPVYFAIVSSAGDTIELPKLADSASIPS